MKKFLTLFLMLNFTFCILQSFAQSPLAIPYQAVARDNSGNPIANQNISLKFSVRDVSAVGTIVYSETQTVSTNLLGLFTANIGQGTVLSGTFATINWGGSLKFMQVEMDATGGTNYTDMGTQQMLSVPYALYSLTAGSTPPDASKINKAGDTMNGALILNADPGVALGAATKQYVDDADALKVNLAGGTMTGALILNANPGVALGAATKQYVDGISNWTKTGNDISNSNSGKVGIGTTTPANKLTVKFDGQGFSQESLNGLVKLGTYVDNSGAYIQTHTNHPLLFATNNAATQAALLVNGNFGIGITAPNQKLDVAGVINTSTGFKIANGAATTGTYLRGNGTNFVASPLLGADISGIIPVTNGGTGAATLTGYVKGTGTTSMTAIATIPGNDITGDISGNAANVTGVVAVVNGGTGSSGHFVGESYGGGTVFYVYDGGLHGLIAAPAPVNGGNPIRWHAGTNTNTVAFADGIGAGKANTALIIANQGLGDGGTYAARLCNEYSVNSGGVTYADWYLPSKFELNLLRIAIGMGGGGYWSSTEGSSAGAWRQDGNLIQYITNKSDVLVRARAIRSF